ncbi:MAG: carbohydrate kinase family protein [Methanobacterium sp.]|nr:carbohydrate kinase family protein [Methanobacterium sp.]
MKLDAIGFGALNMDKLFQVNKIAHNDEESYIIGSSESFGGSAANTIVGLSRLGMKTGFIGKIGPDREGSLLYNNLKNENINTNGVIITSNGKSGSVNGYVDIKGQRALYVDPGVNDCIGEKEVDNEYVDSTKVFHITSFVGNFHEKSINTQKNILNEISSKVSVSFDPGRLYIERGIEFLDKYFIHTDILLINQTELNLLMLEKTNAKDIIKIELNINKIQEEYGIEIVAVKMGDKGSFVSNYNESYFIEAFDVPCVDTTGAGDAFNAGFLYGYITGESLKQSAIEGNYIASRCITENGATDGLPDISKLENFINRNQIHFY